MTGTQYIANFERFEKKYIMNTEQMQLLRPVLDSFMQPDLYPTSTNCSIYMDTKDHLLIRRSISKPDYKEKLRLRSYGTPGREDTVFLEIKKKTGGIVYKRRISPDSLRGNGLSVSWHSALQPGADYEGNRLDGEAIRTSSIHHDQL